MEAQKQNVMLFPFMAQGHIIPFLALALELENKKNCSITFVNTRLNVRKIQPLIPPNSCIRLVEIPFDGTQMGLPPNTENTDSLPPMLAFQFMIDSHILQPAFSKLISDFAYENEGAPLCIISDMCLGWSAKVAHEYGAFHAIFNTGGVYGIAVLYTVALHLPHNKTDSVYFPLPGFPEGYRLHRKHLNGPINDLKIGDPQHLFWQQISQSCKESDGMLFNTVEEMELVGLEYFRNESSCPVWSIGPILSSLGSKARAEAEARKKTEDCMKWLGLKQENSVLYIAFGSMSELSPSQVTQMALALESTTVNFIWVVRSLSDSNIEEGLLGNFEYRMRESKQGILLHKWAPQLEILSHKSVAVFLTHCGWNSALEALSNGVPMLSWPMGAEQPFNAMMLEKMGVCLNVGTGSNEIEHIEIRNRIELVMGGTTKGKEMKQKACEIKELLIQARSEDHENKGSSSRNMDAFLKAAFSNKKMLDTMMYGRNQNSMMAYQNRK